MARKQRRPKSYWTEHRKKCIAEGRCYKCSEPLFKTGFCKTHYEANREHGRRRYKDKKHHHCSGCGKPGHHITTCTGDIPKSLEEVLARRDQVKALENRDGDGI